MKINLNFRVQQLFNPKKNNTDTPSGEASHLQRDPSTQLVNKITTSFFKKTTAKTASQSAGNIAKQHGASVSASSTFSLRADNLYSSIEEHTKQDLIQYLDNHASHGVIGTEKYQEKIAELTTTAYAEIDAQFIAEWEQRKSVDGQLPAKLISAREQAKTRLATSLVEISSKKGWQAHQSVSGSTQWERNGPLLIKRGLSLQKIRLEKADVAKGSFGAVSVFNTQSGGILIGKTARRNDLNSEGQIVDDLGAELDAYEHVYRHNQGGPHPNLVNAYGIKPIVKKRSSTLTVLIPKKSETTRALMMDAIPGPTGDGVFKALRSTWQSGKISSEEYWSAIQFIGRRLFDVTAHLAQTGITHNDIKPENFIVNANTGEPILFDLGLYTPSEATSAGGTRDFRSPESRSKHPEVIDERSDVFTVGATLLDGIEQLDDIPKPYRPRANKGLEKLDECEQDENGNIIRIPGTFLAETAYSRFMHSVLSKDKASREFAMGAKKLDFLNDSMLDDDASRKVILKVIALSAEENSKPQEQQSTTFVAKTDVKQWDQQEILDVFHALKSQPNLTLFAVVCKDIEANPSLKNNPFVMSALSDLTVQFQSKALQVALELNSDATWFDALESIADKLPLNSVKSGVDILGVRRATETHHAEQHRIARAIARQQIAPHASLDELRQYANVAEQFLSDIKPFSNLNNRALAVMSRLVRERANVARQLTGLAKSASPLDPADELRDGTDTAAKIVRNTLAFENIASRMAINPLELLRQQGRVAGQSDIPREENPLPKNISKESILEKGTEPIFNIKSIAVNAFRRQTAQKLILLHEVTKKNLPEK